MKQTNLTIVKFNRIEAISISPSEKRKGCQNGCSQSFLVSVLLWASGSVKENLTQFPFIKRSNTLGVNTIFFSFLTEICSSTRWEKLTLTPKSAKNQFKEKTQISYHSWINEKWHHVKLRRVLIQMVASRDIVLQIQKFYYSASSVYIPYLVLLMYNDYSIIG